MQAKDVMTVTVATVTPAAEVPEIARRLIAQNISAMPVVDAQGHVVGIVSEGDLMRRSENETERQPSWWIRAFTEPEARAREYIKTHGFCAQDIMSRNVISVSEDTSLSDIAETLEKNHIKRVTVMRGAKLVGIVSRADLLRGLVSAGATPVTSESDRELKTAIESSASKAGLSTDHVSVVVANGVATLWGMVGSQTECRALGVAAKQVSGVDKVENNINVMPALVRTGMGAQ